MANLSNINNKFLVTTGGHVLIGATSTYPQGDNTILKLYSPSVPRFYLQNTTTGSNITDGSQIYVSGSDLYITNSESANTIFSTNSLERMRIDSSGNVKLAITNATSSTVIGKDGTGMYMETSGSTNALSDMRFQARASGAGSYSAIRIKPSNQSLEFQTSNAVRMLVNSVGNVQILGIGNKNKGNLQLGPETTGSKWSILTGSHYNATSGSGNGSGSAGVMMIGVNAENGENHIVIGGAIYEANAATDIQFWTHTTDTSTAGGTERMRITSAGRVTINNKPNSGLGYAVLIDVGTGATGDVGYQTLSQLNTNLAGASDIRFKKNIEIIPNAIEKIKTINGYTFDWDSENEDYNYSEKEGRDAGIIAQEIQKVLPEIVQIATVDRDEEGKSTSGKNYLSVDYKKIIPLLIQGIKEQETSIQELKAEIELLKSK